MCRFDENRRLKLITITDLSLTWNRNISSENASIMCQREKDWELRPVFIDGLSFIQMLLPSSDSKPLTFSLNEEKSEIPTSTTIPSKDSGVDVDCSTSGYLNEHESTTPETSPNISSDSEDFQCNQTFSMKCRLHSDSEKKTIDTSSNQLTLKRQVLLVCSFLRLSVFHFQRRRQIHVFLLLVSRHLPEMLPTFMQKSMLDVIGPTISSLRS
ncbi:hypothetical protein B9Z55_028453 [Caenorhabditis nigoni]|uniref:Uncharacterized protein n=1 Tax=Caenorhabditis nigoni TaxID=1611254 RepID=A0A2G5SBM2_9PELO|nr:hypothetical protein B9Z55_028453 [Caenorhabditis nigoni]